MLFRRLTLLFILICTNNLLQANGVTGYARQQFIKNVLKQPLPKIKQCAQQGYLVYQNGLALLYISGHLHLDVDRIKAYAWAQVALEQLRVTHNPTLMNKQVKYVNFIGEKLSEKDRLKGLHLANTYQTLWGRNWPSPPVLDFAHVNKNCRLTSDSPQ